MKEMKRRTFLTQTAGYAAGLSLLAFPGIKTGSLAAQETLATQGNKSKEEILKELEAKVYKFMPMYGTCSQASFAALNEQFGFKADQTIPALMPFAGGIAGKGETCGAVSGSMLAIGFFLASLKRTGREQAVSSLKYARSFLDGFEKEFGSTRCREVVKHQYGRYYDFLNPEDQKEFMAESQKNPKCIEVIKKAVFIAGDIILEYS